jgi:hypothetical protein
MATAESSVTNLMRLDPPNTGAIRAWLVRSDESRVAQLRSVLDQDEAADVDRLAVSADRDDAVVARGMWRMVAAGLLDARPEGVEVERTAFGRLVPAGLPRTSGDLAVAAAKGLVLVAASRDGVRLGVGLAHRLSAAMDDRVAEATEGIAGPALELIPDRVERLACCWGLHQALMQADGRGIHLGSGMITAEVRSLWGWNQAKVAGNGWWVRRLRMPDGHEGAVACSAPAEEFDLIDLDGATEAFAA